MTATPQNTAFISGSNPPEGVVPAGPRRPWHGMGKEVPEGTLTSAQAMVQGGQDWAVSLQDVWMDSDEESEDPDSFKHLTEFKAVMRSDTKANLGIVGSRYAPLQNKDAFSIFDPLVKEQKLTYDTVGTFKGGRIVWVLAKMNKVIEPVRGDTTETYLLLSNRHDGGGSVKIFPTSLRVVCLNTLLHAERSANRDKLISLRHSGDIETKIKLAKVQVMNAMGHFDEYADFAKTLARFEMNTANWKIFSNKVIELISPQTAAKAKKNPEYVESKALKGIRDKLTELFESGVGTDIPGVRGTGWGALQAWTEYNNHHRGVRNGNHRLESAWFGSGATVTKGVMKQLTVMVGN